MAHTGPSPERFAHGAVFINALDTMWIFAGADDGRVAYNDMYAYNAGTKTMAAVMLSGTVPTPRWQYSYAFASNYLLYVWGGLKDIDSTPTSTYDDLYTVALSAFGYIYGDPHFRSPSGGMYTITGEAGKIYNIISTSRFQWNMQFVSRRLNPLSGSNAGPCGFVVPGHTLSVEPAYFTVTLDGALHRHAHSSSLSLGSLTNYVRLYRKKVIVRGPCFKVILELAPKTIRRKRTTTTSTTIAMENRNHFSFEVERVDKAAACRAHGLLGQSYSFTTPVHPSGDNGEGVIEGFVTDYEEPTLLSTSSPFSLYNRSW
eukprot:NODE_2375_length_1436_cov_104.354151_g2258_i0.p1 GENE.NODE_2375_length_1436_cov_104.354151_g2258_i0~~NODE_2375_length_1436_cov_104.354151_g2258_i0.p1  ORF type:complete len:315 (+),score=32.84 NODE_2375_length_1436_cov_104.354151_g2258_i0:355-1299(+)